MCVRERAREKEREREKGRERLMLLHCRILQVKLVVMLSVALVVKLSSSKAFLKVRLMLLTAAYYFAISTSVCGLKLLVPLLVYAALSY